MIDNIYTDWLMITFKYFNTSCYVVGTREIQCWQAVSFFGVCFFLLFLSYTRFATKYVYFLNLFYWLGGGSNNEKKSDENGEDPPPMERRKKRGGGGG